MILEVIDQGRIERIGVVNGSASKDIDGRAYIGGYRLNSSGYESVWFDKFVGWNYRISSRNCVTDEVVFDGLGFEWMKVSNPFVDIQTRSY